MLGTEIGVLFSPSDTGKLIRNALEDPHPEADPYFWAGTFIVFDLISTIFGILSTFSAWAIVSALSPSNAHSVLRSTIGVYACMLPARMLLASIYFFLIWLILLISVMTVSFSIIMTLAIVILFVHIVSTYSAFANLVIETGALSPRAMFSCGEEETMKPMELTVTLIERANENRKKRLEIMSPTEERDVEQAVETPKPGPQRGQSRKSAHALADIKYLKSIYRFDDTDLDDKKMQDKKTSF